MTDKTYFHPETGKTLHPVPEGATIPKDTPFGREVLYAGGFLWISEGVGVAVVQNPGSVTRWTAEPIAPPVPPLPTEPGSLIRATNHGGVTCAVLTLDSAGYWVGVAKGGGLVTWKPSYIADWSPVMVVPNGVGALDETDKRPVMCASGRWTWSDPLDVWECSDDSYLRRGTKKSIARFFGPLTFADGSAS